MLTALIVDDEPLAHQVILHHLKLHPQVKVIGLCNNATQAMQSLAKQSVDILFLDINMPELNGMDMLKVLANRPKVIITTAYQEYALQGYELDVIDYLMKPISAQRLTLALEKVYRAQKSEQVEKSNATLQNPIVKETKYIVLKVNRELRKFQLDRIVLFEAYGNYVKVWQDEGASLVSSTLKNLLSQLPESLFVQIHKSYVVNQTFVTAVNNDYIIMKNQHRVKIGNAYKINSKKLLTC